jgi:hypothetical protein
MEEEKEKIRYFKWSNGEKYERSYPDDKRKIEIEQSKKSMEEEIIDNHMESFNNNIIREDLRNKREENAERLKDRDLPFQSNMNPFMNSTNYVEDITNRDNFLRPINSNFK